VLARELMVAGYHELSCCRMRYAYPAYNFSQCRMRYAYPAYDLSHCRMCCLPVRVRTQIGTYPACELPTTIA
jgi:hypothetical protein